MFSFRKKQEGVTAVPSQKIQNAPDAAWLAGVQVHTMPDKFLLATHARSASSGSASRRMLWAWVSVGILLTGLVGVAAYIYFGASRPQPAQQPADVPPSKSALGSQPPSIEDIPPPPDDVTMSENTSAQPVPDQSEFLTPTTTRQVPPREETVATGQQTLPTEEETMPEGPRGPGVDTDRDGLTDMEEALFGTAAVTTDSDADGYEDGTEVLSFYDPRAGGGAVLRDSTSVREFVNTLQGYRVLYPSAWTAAPLDSGQADVVFAASTGESFEVLAQQNVTGATDAGEWFAQTFSDISLESTTSLTLTSGLRAIKTNDGTRVYIVTPDTVFYLTFQAALASYWQYLATFSMFVNSLTLSAQ